MERGFDVGSRARDLLRRHALWVERKSLVRNASEGLYLRAHDGLPVVASELASRSALATLELRLRFELFEHHRDERQRLPGAEQRGEPSTHAALAFVIAKVFDEHAARAQRALPLLGGPGDLELVHSRHAP